MIDKINQARQAGYSDSEIADFLAGSEDFGSKINQARQNGYSDDEVISYLSGAAQPQAETPKPQREISKLESAVTGLGQGASANSGDEIIAGVSAPVIYAAARNPLTKTAAAFFGGSQTLKDLENKSLKEVYRDEQLKNQREVREAQKANPLSYMGGDLTGAVVTAAKAAPTKAAQVTANYLKSGPLWARMAKSVPVGFGSGALYGAGAADSDKIAQEALSSGKTGAMFAPALPLLSAAKNAVIPKVANPALAERAKQLGVPLRVDQVAPSRFLNTVQKVSQELPLSGSNSFDEVQRKSFNKAVAKTIGQNSDDLGPETIKNYTKEANKKFENILGEREVKIDVDDLAKIESIKEEAANNLGSDLLAIVNRNVDSVLADIQSGTISGKKLASIRSNLLDRSSKAQGESKHFIGNIVEYIDEIANKNISPAETQSLKNARQEWRNFRTLEPLLEKSTDGSINPPDLINKVGASKYIKASRSGVGQDDLIDLARIGREFLAKKGGSDTLQKSALGAGAIGTFFDPTTGAFLLGSALANRGLQGVNRNQALTNALIKSRGAKNISPKNYPKILPTVTGAAVSD